MKLFVSLQWRGLLALGLACAATVVHAQADQAPRPAPRLTVAAPTASPGVGTVPRESGRAPQVGATARHLLAAQSSGRVAGSAVPMSGATASLSWKRYVDSFAHPIPEFFESRVGKKAE